MKEVIVDLLQSLYVDHEVVRNEAAVLEAALCTYTCTLSKKPTTVMSWSACFMNTATH